MLGQFKQRTFFSLKPTGQHSFMNQKQKKEREGHDKCSNWIFWRDPVSFSSLFPSCPVLMGDRTWLPSVVWSLFEMFHLLIFFSLIVLCCETVSPPGRSTHSVREKRLTFNSKTSSGNRNHVINKKKNAQVLTYLSILLYYSSYNSWSLSVVSFFFFSFLNLPEWSYRSVWAHHMNVYWTCLWRCVSVRKVCVCVSCFFFRAGASVRSLHTYVKTSSVDLYQKPKTLQSVLVSLVLRLDESNKIDKLEKKKIITAHLEFCFVRVKFWSKGFASYS